MLISLNWLTDYIEVSLPVGELADLLTRIGLYVDAIHETDADVVLDLEVTSSRPDCLGYLGVARELAAATGQPLRLPDIGHLPAKGDVLDLTSVRVDAPDLCPRYTARVVRKVKVAPSPDWIVQRIESAGLRPVNNVVDVTNFVLMEYGQPLHAFDYDKLAEHRIVVRRAADGEVLTAIDGTTCRLDASMLVIADAKRPVAVAGVMGGRDTEVGSDTVNVLIESAQFDPLSTRQTSRKLALMSESNYRFERGVDPVRLEEASRRACQLICRTAGGQLAAGVADVWARPYQPPQVALRPQRTNKLLGIDTPAERQIEILAALELSPRREGDRIVCTIPSHRADLVREVDLIEEVARLVGYDRIPAGHSVTHPVVGISPEQRLRRRAAEVLAAAGFDEAVTTVFLNDRQAAQFGHDDLVRVQAAGRKADNVLRPSLLPSLLAACKVNQDVGNHDVRLWELAAVFPAGSGELPDERTDLALVTTGELRDLRGAVEALVEQIAPDAALDVVETDAPGFASGAAAELRLDDELLGVIGCIAPAVQEAYGLEQPVGAAALRFDVLRSRAQLNRRYQPLPRFPAVQRDLSIVVDDAVAWRQIAAGIAAVDQPLRVGVEYVTTYTGKPIPRGRKSVTVRLTYRAADRTLRSDEVDQLTRDVVNALGEGLRAKLRA